MQKVPRITVIIPILNAMPYLPEALSSLEAQTFRDFEVCLWDNGSTDGSVEEARRWIPKRLPGRVVSGNPLPLHECLAKMVEEAQTEFVARMDGDDICLPERFESQISAILKNPDLGIVGGQCIYIGSDGKHLGDQEVLPSRHDDILTQMLFRSALTHPALLFRRTAILEAGNYQLPKPIEDLDLYFRISFKWKFQNLEVPVLKYRIHPNSICRSNELDHAKRVIEVVGSHAPKTYGMATENYVRLRNRQSGCAVAQLLASARYRACGSFRRFFALVFSYYFVCNGRCLTGSRDYFSKMVYRLLELFVRKPTSVRLRQETV